MSQAPAPFQPAPANPSTAGLSLLSARRGVGSTTFRLDNSVTLGPQKSQWGRHVGSRKTQGVVTSNIAIDPKLYDVRIKNTKDVDSKNRIGGVSDAKDLNIDEHELLFGMKTQGAGRAGGAANGFTSFAGIKTNAFATQDDFEDNIRFLGRAKASYYFNNPEQGTHSVASQVRGACSMAARTTEEFFVGDKIAWRAPSIDALRRATEAKQTHVPFDMDPSKLLASVVPVTYAYTHLMPQRAYARYLAEARAPAGDEKLRSRQGEPRAPTRHADRLVRFAITYLRTAGMLKLYAGLAVLVEKGIVEIKADFSPAVGTYTAAVADANAPLQQKSRIGPEQALRLAGLAYALDLVEGRPRETWLKPATQLIADVVETQCRGLAAAGSVEFRRLPLSRFLDAAAAGPAFGRDAALDKVQVNAVRREVQSFNETKRREDEKVIGVSLSHTLGGGILDYCM